MVLLGVGCVVGRPAKGGTGQAEQREREGSRVGLLDALRVSAEGEPAVVLVVGLVGTEWGQVGSAQEPRRAMVTCHGFDDQRRRSTGEASTVVDQRRVSADALMVPR